MTATSRRSDVTSSRTKDPFPGFRLLFCPPACLPLPRSRRPVAMNSDAVYAGLFKCLDNAPICRIGSDLLTFEPQELDAAFQEKARKELREEPENVRRGLDALRELLKGETDLVVPTEDFFLEKFLRPCKWNPQSSLELMKHFYRYRQKHPRYCDKLIPSNCRKTFVSNVLVPLPVRCADGVRVLLVEGGKKWKPKEVSVDEMFKGIMLAIEAAIAEPKTQVAGVRVLFDLDGFSFSQVTYFTPSFAAASADWVQHCLPARLKGIHIVNQPYLFNVVFAVFRPFLQEKLRKRIHFHGTDRESLLEYIDAPALPQRFGGQLELPEEPVGEEVYKYFYNFEEIFKVGTSFGYHSKK